MILYSREVWYYLPVRTHGIKYLSNDGWSDEGGEREDQQGHAQALRDLILQGVNLYRRKLVIPPPKYNLPTFKLHPSLNFSKHFCFYEFILKNLKIAFQTNNANLNLVDYLEYDDDAANVGAEGGPEYARVHCLCRYFELTISSRGFCKYRK